MDNNVLSKRELQIALSHILKDFADYCDENGLKYVLCCGTLLGAIRHKGIIPWDDDIDVSMPREDYDRLHELIKTKPLKEKYRLESLLAGNSANPYAKIFDTEIELLDSESSLKNNIWIDVFPVDGIPDELASDYQSFSSKIFRDCILLEYSSRPFNFYGFSVSGLKKTAVSFISHLRPSLYYGKKLDSVARKYNMKDCTYATSICWNGIRGILKSERFYNNRQKAEFEGEQYYIPQDWDEYLTKFYGDYMEIPPEDKRETHNVVARYVK